MRVRIDDLDAMTAEELRGIVRYLREVVMTVHVNREVPDVPTAGANAPAIGPVCAMCQHLTECNYPPDSRATCDAFDRLPVEGYTGE
jgi:hypothetical protein